VVQLPARPHPEHALAAVLGGRRLCTLAFEDLTMLCNQPALKNGRT